MSQQTATSHIWLLKEGEPLPFGPGSALLRSSSLSLALAKRGVRVTWFTSSFDHGRKVQHDYSDRSIEWSPGCSVHFLPGPGYRRNLSLARIWHQRATARQFRASIKQYGAPDLILAAYPSPELCDAACRHARRIGVPFVIDVRDPWPDSFGRGTLRSLMVRPLASYYRTLLRRSCRSAQALISMSEKMLAWSLTYANRSQRTTDRVFHLGYRKHPQNEIFCTQPSAPITCVFYGNFGAGHGGQVVVDAARILQESGCHDVKFVMIGDGDLRSRWQESSENLSNVEFTGWLNGDDAANRLKHADVGIITIRGPIREYWFGNKFFEYCGHGLAIINDTLDDIANLVKRHDIGLNVNPNDAAELAEAVAYLSRDRKQLQSLRTNSARLFQKELDANVIYEQYADHLLHIAADSIDSPHAFSRVI